MATLGRAGSGMEELGTILSHHEGWFWPDWKYIMPHVKAHPGVRQWLETAEPDEHLVVYRQFRIITRRKRNRTAHTLGKHEFRIESGKLKRVYDHYSG